MLRQNSIAINLSIQQDQIERVSKDLEDAQQQIKDQKERFR